MLEPPPLAGATILNAVRNNYGFPVNDLAFLPLGNDASAWAYRLRATKGLGYFLKVRRGPINQGSPHVTRHLFDHGLACIVAPLSTQTGFLWTHLAEYTLILYDYIDGPNAMAAGLSDQQWTAFGSALRQLHDTQLPASLATELKRETCQPLWAATVRALDAHIGTRQFSDASEQLLADCWQRRRTEILSITARAEAIGDQLRKATLACVPCHADAHTANILIDPNEGIRIVDWDDMLLAPKERDLAFVAGATDPTNRTRPRTSELFFRGYGPSEVDLLALSYYRHEWAVQEIGDNGQRVFLQPTTGPETKWAAAADFVRLFEPGHDVAQASQADDRLS